MKYDGLCKLADYYEKMAPTMTKRTLPPASLTALQSLITTLQGCLGATGSQLSNYFINTPTNKDQVLYELKLILTDLRQLQSLKTALPYGLASMLRTWNNFYDTKNKYMRSWFLSSTDRQMTDFINATGMKQEIDKILSWTH